MTALHELTIKAIRRAQAQGGIVDPVEDWSAIAELDRLARAATEGPGERKLTFCDFPVRVGDVLLYRLSWGAMDWVAYCAADWFAHDPVMYDKALAWAYAHGRSPGAFRRCPDKQSATAVISSWAASVCAPWSNIMTAVDELISELSKKKTDTKESSVSTASFLDVLLETHGGTIDYWLWDVSIAAMLALTAAMQHRNDCSENFTRTAAGKAPDPDGSLAKTSIAFQRKAREFVQEIMSRTKRSTNSVKSLASQHSGVEEAQKVNRGTGATAKENIAEDCAQDPKGKRPVNQQELAQAGHKQREGR